MGRISHEITCTSELAVGPLWGDPPIYVPVSRFASDSPLRFPERREVSNICSTLQIHGVHDESRIIKFPAD